MRKIESLTIVVTILAVVALVAFRRAHRHDQLSARAQTFKAIVIAIHTYDQVAGVLPGDGLMGRSAVACSWRWAIKPYLGVVPNHDVSWQDDENRTAVNLDLTFSAPRSTEANVFSIRGQLGRDTNAWGQVSLSALPDDLILLAEVACSKTPWPAPGDFDLALLSHQLKSATGTAVFSQHPDGFIVAFADGQVWCLKHAVPFEVLKHFLTAEDAKMHSREQLLRPYSIRM